MDMYRIHDMLEDVSEAATTELSKGIESVNTKEFGEVVDMIKDLSEAEKNKMQACYYKSIIEAMEKSEYEKDYDWAGPDEDRMGYRNMGMSRRRGYEERIHDPRFDEYRSGRMGYSSSQRMMSPRGSRYGYSHDEYMNEKSMLPANDPKRMKMIEGHMDDMYEMFKEEVQDMSPEEKQMWKSKLNKIINM